MALQRRNQNDTSPTKSELGQDERLVEKLHHLIEEAEIAEEDGKAQRVMAHDVKTPGRAALS